MRRRVFRGSHERGVALLADAPYIHVATTTDAGVPVLRTVNAVVDEDMIAFHGAPAGEKLATLGRPVVIGAEDHVAQIPSYFMDPERACPATTYFRSVQVHGLLQRIDDPVRKARILSRLMAKHQPEGRHVPITADHPLYQKELAAILVAGVSLEHLDFKNKLGQNRRADEIGKLLAGLWSRGQPGDLSAIELVREANPEVIIPPELGAPDGFRLEVGDGCSASRGAEAAALLEGAYWLGGLSREAMAVAQRCADAVVGLRDGTGALVATARAVSDRVRTAWMYDVIVRPDWRGHGLGKAIVETLLRHPAVRDVQMVRLGTRDAMSLYARFGFEIVGVTPTGATEMILRRTAPREAWAQNGTGPASVQR